MNELLFEPVPTNLAGIEPSKPLEQLIAEQGTKPFDFAALRKLATFWPENESVDDFLAAREQWYSDDVAAGRA